MDAWLTTTSPAELAVALLALLGAVNHGYGLCQAWKLLGVALDAVDRRLAWLSIRSEAVRLVGKLTAAGLATLAMFTPAPRTPAVQTLELVTIWLAIPLLLLFDAESLVARADRAWIIRNLAAGARDDRP